jgi:hypothetical protein
MQDFFQKIILFTGLFLWSIASLSQDIQVTHTIISFGNFVDIDNAEAFSSRLVALRTELDHRCTIILNGDLIDGRQNFIKQTSKLDTFLRSVSNLRDTKVVIIPGDRDWNNSGRKGWLRAQLLEEFFEKQNYPNVTWALPGG